jgi:hypothetical protein
MQNLTHCVRRNTKLTPQRTLAPRFFFSVAVSEKKGEKKN